MEQGGFRWTVVGFVREHASDYDDSTHHFNGQVALVGGSAGGNLTYMAGITGEEGVSRPDVMAGFSGHPEMGFMSDGNAACDEAPNAYQQNLCRTRSEAYIGYPLTVNSSQCLDNWAFASPACNIDLDNLPPPTYIANATEELSAYQGAVDFAGFLNGHSDYRLCTVDGADHGTELFNDTCESPLSGTAYEGMIDFFGDYVW